MEMKAPEEAASKQRPRPPRDDGRPISGREAAIAYAAATHPSYIDMACERLAELNFTAGIATAIVGMALSGNCAHADTGDLARLYSAIPKPVPSFVEQENVQGFVAALDVHREQERIRRVRRWPA